MPTQRTRDLESEIRDRIRRDEAGLAEFASDLIRIGSENPPGLEYEVCAERIASWLRELGLEVSTANPSGSGRCVIGTFGEGGRALAASLRDVTDELATFELCPGVVETRHHAALGIAALAYGPGLLSVAHGPDEFVSIERLLECAEIYARTAVRFLS